MKTSGIRVVEVERAWISEADKYRHYGALSLQDRLCILYAKDQQRTLVTGDLPVREVCVSEEVDLRGSLWIVQQAYERGILPAEELLRWIKVWPEKGRRLPKAELKKLTDMLKA